MEHIQLGVKLLNKMKLDKIKKRTYLDSLAKWVLLVITLICASVILIIVGFILVKGIKPFINNYLIDGTNYSVNFFTFISGNTWFTYPNLYSIGYAILNTIYIVVFTLILSAIVSILTALFIARIAPKILGKGLEYLTELLASIPSIIFGVFGKGFVTNIVKNIASLFGMQTAGGLGSLSTILVLTMMIMPTVTLVSITAIKSVNKTYTEASLALGASMTQTNFKVVLKAANPQIFSGLILGIGRALGEATAISMVCGNSGSGPTFSLFDTTCTLTTIMMQSLSETEGLNYDIRFSVGIVLIAIILVTNITLNIVKKRISYDKK